MPEKYDVILIGEEPQGLLLAHLIQSKHSVLWLRPAEKAAKPIIPSYFSRFFSFPHNPVDPFYIFTKGKCSPWDKTFLGAVDKEEEKILFSKLDWSKKKERCLKAFLKKNPNAYSLAIHISNAFGFNPSLSYEKKLYQAFLFSELIEVLPPEGVTQVSLKASDLPLKIETQKKEIVVQAQDKAYRANKVVINCSLEQLKPMFSDLFSDFLPSEANIQGTSFKTKDLSALWLFQPYTVFLTQNYLNSFWFENDQGQCTLWRNVNENKEGRDVFFDFLKNEFPLFDFRESHQNSPVFTRFENSVCTLQAQTISRNVFYIGKSLRSELPYPLGPLLSVKHLYEKHFEKVKRPS